jgi:hypothetical protein
MCEECVVCEKSGVVCGVSEVCGVGVVNEHV